MSSPSPISSRAVNAYEESETAVPVVAWADAGTPAAATDAAMRYAATAARERCADIKWCSFLWKMFDMGEGTATWPS
ncbi:hypothetical protein GCM10010377_16260 [Streptomyces viridiviolaceus]|nr:hypothetical protein GCM10010377_16260 [Streptomyces viridiviolaceus]